MNFGKTKKSQRSNGKDGLFIYRAKSFDWSQAFEYEIYDDIRTSLEKEKVFLLEALKSKDVDININADSDIAVLSYDICYQRDNGQVESLVGYLSRKGKEKNSAFFILASTYLFNLGNAEGAFLKGEFEQLAKLSLSLSLISKSLTVALYEDNILAGGARTSEATKAKVTTSNAIKEKCIKLAKAIKKNPKLSKNKISQEIHSQLKKEFGVVRSVSTINDYLKGVQL